ncbi:phosphopantothenate-cysteine ligase [Rhodotorula toruloides]|uniref:Phosphopantothenate-cysteine ligase n=1 Tax=Rhodotorula toruloides TaxID=5286 RepID=A0A511K9K0_RHOTO|nr:phosphopantothenate-cysteine ligase [Rhodotorula toruloides]
MPSSTQFSAEDFFAQQPPPKDLDKRLEAVQRFVERNVNEGRRVVLITSGGTTVPLEHNVVRFLDNFSAGTRGAASAEHLLRSGRYAVIFLHRQHSLQPFSRHYSHSTNPFLDLLDVVEADGGVMGKGKAPAEHLPLPDGHLFPPIPSMQSPPSSPPLAYTPLPPLHAEEPPNTDHGLTIQIRPPHLAPMLSLLRSYKFVKSLGILHSIPYTTVSEYLWYLRGISRVMGQTKDREGQALGRRGMYYLAAAVSDFFIPYTKMSEHKIQSGKGSLVIEMDQVPKVLKTMVDEWSNEGFIVSFKLETDPSILIPKARTALERYGHQVVIGNLLDTRKHEVVFVQKDGEEWLRLPHHDGPDGKEIEEDIIARLMELHEAWTSKGGV